MSNVQELKTKALAFAAECEAAGMSQAAELVGKAWVALSAEARKQEANARKAAKAPKVEVPSAAT